MPETRWTKLERKLHGEEPDEEPAATASKKPPSRKTAPTGPLPVMAPADGTPGKRQ
jgi:hypothetical protein